MVSARRWQEPVGVFQEREISGNVHTERDYDGVQKHLGGGVNVARMGAQLANVPRGGSVWTFALAD